MNIARFGTSEVEDFLTALPQIGVGVAGIIGITVAIMRSLRQDDEWKTLLTAKNQELDRKDAEIAELRERLEDWD